MAGLRSRSGKQFLARTDGDVLNLPLLAHNDEEAFVVQLRLAHERRGRVPPATRGRWAAMTRMSRKWLIVSEICTV